MTDKNKFSNPLDCNNLGIWDAGEALGIVRENETWQYR